MNLGVEGMMWLGRLPASIRHIRQRVSYFSPCLLRTCRCRRFDLRIPYRYSQGKSGCYGSYAYNFWHRFIPCFGKAMITAAGGTQTSDVFNAKVAAINIPVLSIPYISKIIFGPILMFILRLQSPSSFMSTL